MTTYIRDFSTLGKNDTSIAGGKGANLGELTRAGFFFDVQTSLAA